MPFATIVADPPWRYGDRLPGPKRGAGSHYPTLSLADIASRENWRFPWPELEPDCRLFLWATSPLLPEALHVLSAWGFTYKAGMVWHKLGRMGMGRTVRVQHEHLLIGVRGKPAVLSHSVLSVFEARPLAHSAKPDEAYRLIERLSPGPWVELFGRKERAGWTVLGVDL